MCDAELTELDIENIEEIEATLKRVRSGDLKIVKHEHLIQRMQIGEKQIPTNEFYNMEFLYTCRMCKEGIKRNGVCGLDNLEHTQICPMFDMKE